MNFEKTIQITKIVLGVIGLFIIKLGLDKILVKINEIQNFLYENWV